MSPIKQTRCAGYARRERGAALFVALMILILLTLLALSASQVTGLQERMAGIYRADNLAFQTAEARLRLTERGILASRPQLCDGPPDPVLPGKWVNGVADVAEVRIENLNNATSATSTGLSGYARGLSYQGSTVVGQQRVPGSLNCLIFRLTSYGLDTEVDPSSRSLVQSMFTP